MWHQEEISGCLRCRYEWVDSASVTITGSLTDIVKRNDWSVNCNCAVYMQGCSSEDKSWVLQTSDVETWLTKHPLEILVLILECREDKCLGSGNYIFRFSALVFLQRELLFYRWIEGRELHNTQEKLSHSYAIFVKSF